MSQKKASQHVIVMFSIQLGRGTELCVYTSMQLESELNN